jgi:hypothetical protein
MTTLTRAGTTVTLSDHLQWADEFSWSAVQQSTERSITGSLHVDVAAATGGRQITLESGEDFGWIARQDAEQLAAWRDIPGAEFDLVLRGVTRTVIFDHERTAVEYQPVVDYADPLGSDPCRVTLRFIEI